MAWKLVQGVQLCKGNLWTCQFSFSLAQTAPTYCILWTVCLYVAKVHLEFDIPPPQYSRSWDISKHYHLQLVCLIFDLQVEHREVLNQIFNGVCT